MSLKTSFITKRVPGRKTVRNFVRSRIEYLLAKEEAREAENEEHAVSGAVASRGETDRSAVPEEE